MSRYEEALPDGRTVVFGWDPPLLTYFGQVIDPTRDEDDQIVHWVGCSPEELYEIENLAAAMPAECRAAIGGYETILYMDKDSGS